LPGADLYIEYWGMDTADYKIGMLKKQQVYQQTGKRLVSIYRDDLPQIEAVLAQRLAPFVNLSPVATPRSVPSTRSESPG